MNTNRHFLSYLAQYFLEWKMLRMKFVEEIKNTFFLFRNFFLSKIVKFW